MKRVLFFLLLIAAAARAEEMNYGYIKGHVAILRAMDKITGKVKTMPLKTGASVAFGQLDVKLESCVYKPPEEKPSDAAFLKISERPATVKNGQEESKEVFSGWMFAASPALYAMEHPVYDIWVVKCQSRSSPLPETVFMPLARVDEDSAAARAAAEENQTDE